MKVTVHLHTILQRQTPDGLQERLDVTLPPGSTVADLIQHLSIGLAPAALLVAVNGRVATLDHPLHDGDQVNLMPAISGGDCSMAGYQAG